MTDTDNAPRNIIRDKKVKERTGLGRVQRWRCVKAGTFPAPIQLGPNSVGWYEDEIDQWLADRPRVIYAPPQPAEAEPEPADGQVSGHALPPEGAAEDATAPTDEEPAA